MRNRFLICGIPRSGTSILYTLLCNTLKDIKYYEEEVSALKISDDGETCLTKRPLDCMLLDQIFSKFEADSLKVIFTIRDPRDVICSTHVNVAYDYFIGYQNQYFVDQKNSISRLINPGIRSIVGEWIKHKDRSNMITVKYEDLILKKTETLLRLSDFLEVKLDAENFDINKETKVPKGLVSSLNGIRKLDSNSIGIWKKHPVRVWQEFTNHLEFHDVMNILDYEKSPHWFLNHFKGRLPLQIN